MASGVLTYDNFQCIRCGTCCNKQKVVLLTIYDVFRLAEKLGVKPGEFFREYCTISHKFNSNGLRRFYLKTDGGCPFLKNNLCSVQEVKPVVCARNPFYYMEASLAAYKVFGIIEDECCINEFPYDTMVKGDNERLIDMDILVQATDEYIEKYSRFDEKTAALYYEKSLEDLKDLDLRATAYMTLLNQSVQREAMCRTDEYYQGATNMYLSGFYNEFTKAVKAANGAYYFEPSALGMIDNIMALVLFEKNFKDIKKTLGKQNGTDIHTKVTTFEDREYVIVSVEPKGGKKVMFYYHIQPGEKKDLLHKPGEIMIMFKSDKGGSFIFKGRDTDGWLSSGTT